MRSLACKNFAVFALLSVSGCTTIGGWLGDMMDWADDTLPTYDGSGSSSSNNTVPEGRKSPTESYGSSRNASSSNYGSPEASYDDPLAPSTADPYAAPQYQPPQYQNPYQGQQTQQYQPLQYQDPYQGQQQYQPAPQPYQQQYQDPYQGQYQQPYQQPYQGQYQQQAPQQGYGGGSYQSPMSREPDWDPQIPPPPGGIF